MLCLLSVINRYSSLIRANKRYGKNGGEDTVYPPCRGRAKTPTTSKTEFFVSKINSWKQLTVFRNNLILDVTGALVLHLLFHLL